MFVCSSVASGVYKVFVVPLVLKRDAWRQKQQTLKFRKSTIYIRSTIHHNNIYLGISGLDGATGGFGGAPLEGEVCTGGL